MMATLMVGGCLCGAVRYESSGDSVFSGNCHCRDCQRSSGSGYTPALFVPAQTVKIQGEVKYFESLADSGKKISRGFCPKCGSQMFSKLEILPDMLGLRAGTLDDTSQYHPRVDIYTDSAAHWDVMNSELKKFSRSPR
jgi:hypothetical protein